MRPLCRIPQDDTAVHINMSTDTTKDFVVWWEGDIIIHTDNLSAAKTMAKTLNGFIRSLSKATSVNSVQMQAGLANFVNNALIGTGFNPVIPMV